MSSFTALEDLFLAQGAPDDAPLAVRRWILLVANTLGGALSPLRYHAVVWHARRGALAALFLASADFAVAEPSPPRRHVALASQELGRHLVAFDTALGELDVRTGRPETSARLRGAFLSRDPIQRCSAAAVLAILLAMVSA